MTASPGDKDGAADSQAVQDGANSNVDTGSTGAEKEELEKEKPKNGGEIAQNDPAETTADLDNAADKEGSLDDSKGKDTTDEGGKDSIVEVEAADVEENNTVDKEGEPKTPAAGNINGEGKTEPTTNAENSAAPEASQAMALNVAYEALENIRKMNCAVEFGGMELTPNDCLPCLREQRASGTIPTPNQNRAARFRKMLPGNRAAPCLTCGTPVCPRHRCPDFKKENIDICCDCAKFFALDVVKGSLTVAEGRKQLINSMLDVYDRALLILQYSAQFIQDIAAALEYNTKRNNRIGLGSSGAGFLSGVVGVAAAATIFTPVGPPLLIASILFGAGGTAASAGSEAVNYRCAPNKMADTIIVLHGMVNSISRLTDISEEEALQQEDNNGTENASGAASTRTANRFNKNADETGSRRNWTRATANALKPLTAGALSAASVVMEAREIKATVEKMQAGNPCAKADFLREIGKEIHTIPSTDEVSKEIQKFLDIIEKQKAAEPGKGKDEHEKATDEEDNAKNSAPVEMTN
jgi:hypothetical protein